MAAQGWSTVRGRTARAGAAAGAVLLLAVGCTTQEDRRPTVVQEAPSAPPPASAASPSASAAAPSASPSSTRTPTSAATSSASAAPSAPSAPPTRTATPSAPPASPAPRPAAPTRLTVSAAAPGGLDLVRGGAAREFAVTLAGGNVRAYTALKIVFQMETMIGEDPGPLPAGNGFVLERRDPSSGVWRPVELRVANDVQPHFLFSGGAPLAREAIRTERFRIRAGAEGPTGSLPLMIRVVDTAAPPSATAEQGVPARTSLTVAARRA
ncbi:hypothetical protein ACRAR1_13605 [Streptomyces sanyensis]|uniref:hypothetical protein n=1 Tax=Streptomyces sanyensis TaxID=568869 RepID=UPI003D7745C8